MALPGTGKNFDQFRLDDGDCRQYSYAQIGGNTPERAAADSGAKTAAIGTLIGAAAGAAINGGQGAAVGAGVGLAGGAIAGTGAADQSGRTLQGRYDIAYTQCMYSKGHKVPVSGRFMSSGDRAPAAGNPPPPPDANRPPPPSGTPPAPPPR
jgi:hypothetical protein